MTEEREPGLLGERVAELRERKGMSQEQLGAAARSSQVTISNIETGAITNVVSWRVARIAIALDTTMDYLLDLTDDPRPHRGIQPIAQDEAVRQVLSLPAATRDALAEFLRLAQSRGGTEPQTGSTQ